MLTSSDFFLGGAAFNKWDAAVKFDWGFFHDVWNQPLVIGYVPVCCCQTTHQVKSRKMVDFPNKTSIYYSDCNLHLMVDFSEFPINSMETAEKNP